MNTFESQLGHRLHDMVDGASDSPAPTEAVLSRGRRASRRRTAAMVVTASFAVAAVAGGAAIAVAQPWASSHPGALSAARPQTPQMQLAAAVTASQSVGYHVKVSETYGGPSVAATTEGAFDPATATGYLNSGAPGSGVVYYERLVDGVLYTGSSGGDEWKQEPGKSDHLDYDRNLGGSAGSTVDPQQLFAMLRHSGATVTQTGSHTYHFEVALGGAANGLTSDRYSGDVTLDGDHRIAKVAYQRTMQMEKHGQTYTDHDSVTVELSGYGAPVKVDKPTDVVVVK